MVFGTLLITCLYFDHGNMVRLSSPLEIPFLGCFLLLRSRITITGFHHLLGWDKSWVLLVLTVVLGRMFVALQMYELHEVGIKLLDTTFHARRFCTIGLHFMHVLLGVIGLITLLFVGVANFGVYRCTVIT